MSPAVAKLRQTDPFCQLSAPEGLVKGGLCIVMSAWDGFLRGITVQRGDGTTVQRCNGITEQRCNGTAV